LLVISAAATCVAALQGQEIITKHKLLISFYKNKNLKQPTYPLRLFKTTNVRVSGVTESSGTSYLDNTYSKVISNFSLTLSQ
jgi:hypothetical protein